MTSGPIWKHIVVFSIPLMIGNLFQQMYNTVDTLVIGNYLGPSVLASVGSGSVVISMMLSLFTGLGVGSGVVIAQFFGARDDEGVGRAVGTAATFTLISGAIMTVVWYLLAETSLRALGTPEAIMPDAALYLKMIFLGITPTMIFNIGSGILRAIGDSRTPLMYLSIATVINIVLDVAFIAGAGMGVEGVAIATFFAQTIAAILVVLKLVDADGPHRLRLRSMKIHATTLARIFKVGIPAAFQSALMEISNLVVQSYVNALGATVIAAWSVSGKIDSVVFLPINSLGMAVMTFAGQNFGARRIDRVRAGMKWGMTIATIVGVSTSMFVLLFSRSLLGLFTDDAPLIEAGHSIMMFMVPFYFLCGIMYVLAGVNNGVNAALPTMVIMLFSLCVFRVAYLNIMADRITSPELILIMYAASWTICSAFLLTYYLRGKWARDLEQ